MNIAPPLLLALFNLCSSESSSGPSFASADRAACSDYAWICYLYYLIVLQTINTVCDVGLIYEPLILLHGSPLVAINAPKSHHPTPAPQARAALTDTPRARTRSSSKVHHSHPLPPHSDRAFLSPTITWAMLADGYVCVVQTLISTPTQLVVAWRIKLMTKSWWVSGSSRSSRSPLSTRPYPSLRARTAGSPVATIGVAHVAEFRQFTLMEAPITICLTSTALNACNEWNNLLDGPARDGLGGAARGQWEWWDSLVAERLGGAHGNPVRVSAASPTSRTRPWSPRALRPASHAPHISLYIPARIPSNFAPSVRSSPRAEWLSPARAAHARAHPSCTRDYEGDPRSAAPAREGVSALGTRVRRGEGEREADGGVGAGDGEVAKGELAAWRGPTPPPSRPRLAALRAPVSPCRARPHPVCLGNGPTRHHGWTLPRSLELADVTRCRGVSAEDTRSLFNPHLFDLGSAPRVRTIPRYLVDP
ncbi:hypothetical protein FB451DRAFT_1395127 [Mycena latifolia]|nr:hypothetical protein FB451DRAFT_1395127 [Mycena latifolia]